MLKLIRDEQYGISFESDETGKTYDLLEMVSYKGHTTSDIVMIMVATRDEGYIGMLDYCFGASFEEDTLEYARNAIEEYEEGHRQLLDVIAN